MFEQTLEQMVATVFIDAKDSRLADQYGITLPAGNNTITSAAAIELVRKFDSASAQHATRLCLRLALTWKPRYDRKQSQSRTYRGQS